MFCLKLGLWDTACLLTPVRDIPIKQATISPARHSFYRKAINNTMIISTIVSTIAPWIVAAPAGLFLSLTSFGIDGGKYASKY